MAKVATSICTYPRTSAIIFSVLILTTIILFTIAYFSNWSFGITFSASIFGFITIALLIWCGKVAWFIE